MPSPDVSSYVDLTLYDKTAADLLTRANAQTAAMFPDYVPAAGDPSQVLLEAESLIVSELVYAINRLPGAVFEVLLQVMGVAKLQGVQAAATATFTASDTLGHVIPQGTNLVLNLGSTGLYTFTTNTSLTIPAGQTTVTGAITAVQYAAAPNGTTVGTPLSLTDSIYWLQTITLAASPAGGVDPETDQAWLARSAQRLSGLVSTLVLPAHFTNAALSYLGVYRATTVDNYNPAGNPGRVDGSCNVTSGSSTVTDPSITTGDAGRPITAVGGVATAGGAAAIPAGCYVGTVTPGTSFVISSSPVVNAPVSATATQAGTSVTFGALGTPSAEGYVAVAVLQQSTGLGNAGAPLAATDKTTLQNQLIGEAHAGLTVTVIDPIINTIDVTVTVKGAPGYTTATVQTNVQQAVQAWLSTDSWQWGATVPINALAAIISQAAGVAYVTQGGLTAGIRGTTLTANDIPLGGAAPLASAGTITTTVT